MPSMTSCTQAPGIYCCSTKWSCCQTAFKIRTVFPIERAALYFSRGHQLRQRFSVENMLVWVFSLKSCTYRTPFPTNTEGTSQKRGKRVSELEDTEYLEMLTLGMPWLLAIMKSQQLITSKTSEQDQGTPNSSTNGEGLTRPRP